MRPSGWPYGRRGRGHGTRGLRGVGADCIGAGRLSGGGTGTCGVGGLPFARHQLVHRLDAAELGEQHGRRYADDEGGVPTADLSRCPEQHRGPGTHQAVYDGRDGVDDGVEVRLELRSLPPLRCRGSQLPVCAPVVLPGIKSVVQVQRAAQ